MANQVAYGFVGLENLFTNRPTDENIQIIRDAITQSLAEHNRQAEELLAEFAERTTGYTVRFMQPGAGTLQPLDDKGNPLPVRENGFYDVAFPLQGGGTAWGDNRVTRELMTIGEINDLVLGSLRRDSDWMRRHVLAALLDEVEWTYQDDQRGALTIVPLANGDTVEYIRRNGTLATDDHYFAQAAAIDNSNNPFPTIYSALVEHPVNAGALIVAYVPTALVASVLALDNFLPIPDADVELGNANDRLGVPGPARGFGDEVLGKTDKVWVVEYSTLPDEHILAVARGSAEPPLKMREYPAASLQGLIDEEHSPDGNHLERRVIRYAGFGGFNRVGAVVYQVGNATYEVPTDFDAPLNV